MTDGDAELTTWPSGVTDRRTGGGETPQESGDKAAFSFGVLAWKHEEGTGREYDRGEANERSLLVLCLRDALRGVSGTSLGGTRPRTATLTNFSAPAFFSVDGGGFFRDRDSVLGAGASSPALLLGATLPSLEGTL